ncbi:hypothetical protein, partial [Pseudomonas aeruginosa]|uniref:hypothetical protein n=1 Tax=Pseudomonas aeruginosa TaxID=287 RepID=UPI0015F295B2
EKTVAELSKEGAQGAGPDLTLILCGALLIRYAWMQARAAAPPAHPRVTGDHHA